MIVAQPAQLQPVVQPAEEEKSTFDMQPAQLPDVQPAQMLPDVQPAQMLPDVQPAQMLDEPAQLHPIVPWQLLPLEEEKERPSGNVNVSDEVFATIKKEYKAHFATPLRQGWRTHSFIRKALKLDEKLLSFKSESDVILVLVQLMLVGLLD